VLYYVIYATQFTMWPIEQCYRLQVDEVNYIYANKKGLCYGYYETNKVRFQLSVPSTTATSHIQKQWMPMPSAKIHLNQTADRNAEPRRQPLGLDECNRRMMYISIIMHRLSPDLHQHHHTSAALLPPKTTICVHRLRDQLPCIAFLL